MFTGVSLYVGSGFEKNACMLKKAYEAGARYTFTSLHIPEETSAEYQRDARDLIRFCGEKGVHLIADVSPHTLEKLGVSRLEELADFGIDYVRLDYGFDAQRIIELSRVFHVVFNASTITEDVIRVWQEAGADFSRFAACHNYYPKRYTGLSIERVARSNARLKSLGFQTLAFIPGDAEKRCPLFEGLPTVEEHRDHTGVLLARDALELYDAQTDVVFIGDISASEGVWKWLRAFSEGHVPLRVELDDTYDYLYGRVQHDRVDSSDYLIRSQESRLWTDASVVEATPAATEGPVAAPCVATPPVAAASSPVATTAPFTAEKGALLPVGTILVSAAEYGRYVGEVSITKKELPLDPRDAVVGRVTASDIPLLSYIHTGRGFTLEKWSFA
ncbi:MupG family TIM beta-alpha barrel fold protein [Atopobium sp. oral taxon 199]|uniref:MupG family TIM beta-alpha barrel fold protein n=1 Tax=Atopobium sp. oral taxon 199 TaxID=712156 RepID=UPI00034EB852|nr:MupG family TIM beta-alpha barrel fold protein [Atopobium sp. oral taxon 199]EPD77063.1 hypothetical protein HMPREF1527_01484 [Atopobium sp. oral taxon 199 str. F0494]